MDTHKILRELYEQRHRLDEALAALERIAASRGQAHRGRKQKEPRRQPGR